MVRALADHVSAVYFMTADCYETAEEEPQELLPILNFLIDLLCKAGVLGFKRPAVSLH